MNIVQKLALASSAALLISVNTHAHEASEHMKDAQSPDCAAMAEMDHEKMDMNDPVMAAMMKQCMATDAHGEVAASGDAHAEHNAAAANTESHAEHSHDAAAPVTAAAVVEEAHQH
tara:strand:- start:9626 stop:9973 length:348 start_codon:yes stop_codon:yes gene_type:complete